MRVRPVDAPAASARVRPVDALLAAYNAVAAAAWIPALGKTPAAAWILLAHLLGVLLPLALRRLDAGAPLPLRALREAYPLLLLYPFFAEVGALHGALHSAGYDRIVRGWDAAIFPGEWHRTWAVAAPWPWLSELMHGLYFSYYLLLAGPPLAAALLRRREAFRDIAYRTMLTYTACYAVYLFFPTFGPGHVEPPPQGAAPPGFFARPVQAAIATGDAPGTAFPSSHVAGAFTAGWLGARWFPWPVARVQLLLACGVAVATVYTHHHYPIDAAAGLLLAWLLQRFAAPALERAMGNDDAPGSGEPRRVERNR